MARAKAGVDIQLGVLPPEDAIARFQAKQLLLPSFRWDDIWQQEHARGVASAGVMRYDVLQLLSDELGMALDQSSGTQAFVERVRTQLVAKGFWGEVPVTDPTTGEVRTTRFNDYRLKLIHDVNIRQALNAGKWDRAQRNAQHFPYLRYITKRDERVRASHRAWDGVVERADSPWWDTHMPMNGWRCRCDVQVLSQRQYDRLKAEGRAKNTPLDTMVNWVDPNDPQRVQRIPLGIDPPFAYNPGKAPLRGVVPQALVGEPLQHASVTASGSDAVPAMPFPRQQPASALLAPGVDNRAAVQTFLAEFGAAIGRPAVFTDVQGERLVIDEELFKVTGSSDWQVPAGRAPYLRLIAQTIQQPDEVWVELRAGGKGDVRRRYLARYQMQGQSQPVLVVFETGPGGWTAVAANLADLGANLLAIMRLVRAGSRVYVRGAGA